MKPISFRLNNTSSYVFNGLITLILGLFFSNYFFDFGIELNVILAILGIITTCVLVLSYKRALLYLLSFAIPLSIPVTLYGDSRIGIPSELICVILSAFLLIKVLLGSKLDPRILKHPITILVLMDLGWLLVSSIFSQMPDVSFKRFIVRLCYYITFYYFLLELFNQDLKNIKRIFTLHTLGFLAPITYAMVLHARLGYTTVGSQRISAPFYYDHTIYGACLVFFIPFLTFYTLKSSQQKDRVLYGSLLGIFTVAAALSYSRAAWISLLLALTVNLILKYKIKLSYLACAAGVLLSLLVLNRQRIQAFLRENKEISHSNDISMHLKSISNVNTDASNRERINRWKCAFRMFDAKPLTGFGPGTYQFFYGKYQQREDLTRISTYNGTKGHAHSEYLNYLSETGLPGLLIFVSLIVAVFVKALGLIRKRADQIDRDLALCIFTGLLTFFIHAFFNGFLEFDKVAMPVFASFAAIVALDLKRQSPAKE